MLQRTDIVGFRIKRILADTSLSDDAINFADFVLVLETGSAFRMPYDDDHGAWLTNVSPSSKHQPVRFPLAKYWHYRSRLWRTTVNDVLVPADPKLRFPDSARVRLDSGWYIAAWSGTPVGIFPTIDIIPSLDFDDRMVSIWSLVEPSAETAQ
jgi:hypothetical protein